MNWVSALRDGAAYFFSPPGRRWPEGSDEGAASPYIATLAPHPAAADFFPAGRRNEGHALVPQQAFAFKQAARRKPRVVHSP